jgi:hypothetical protein
MLPIATSDRTTKPEVDAARISGLLFEGLKQMAKRGTEGGLLFGLRGIPEYLGHHGNQWESWITKELARECSLETQVQYPLDAVRRFQQSYPVSRGANSQFCDLVLRSDEGTRIWIECKSIFESVLLKREFQDGPERKYRRDYLAEKCSNQPSKTGLFVSIEEVLIDAAKLEAIRSIETQYLGLLVLEFDRVQARIDDTCEYKELLRDLTERGWNQVARETWPDQVPQRAERGFQEHATFFFRKCD